MSFLDVFRLCLLRATTEQQDEPAAVLHVIDAIRWPVVDAQLAHRAADALPVSTQASLEPIQPRCDACAARGVGQLREPLSQRLAPACGLVLQDFEHWHCSPKAT